MSNEERIMELMQQRIQSLQSLQRLQRVFKTIMVTSFVLSAFFSVMAVVAFIATR